jgi:hypothetical protein
LVKFIVSIIFDGKTTIFPISGILLPSAARGWQDVTQQTKVQQRLELQHSQRESAETQLTTDRKEMQRLQVWG